jgi:CRP-like cAMP-binding protein
MSMGEIFGYIASILVFVTFYMKTMVPLRLVAIASNVAFITYSGIEGLTPIFILHCALLPLNVLRLVQLRDFLRQVQDAAAEGFSIQAIMPLMRRRTIRAGETLFAANELANELYYVSEGALFLPELQQEIGPGGFVGEFALFSDSGRRTATVVARTDCTLMVLSRNAVFSALLQHPRLGIHLLKLVTARLLQNTGREAPVARPVEAAPAILEPAWYRRRSTLLRVAAVAFFLAGLGVVVTYHPLYNVFYRDAVLTTWANVATAPISGTVETLDARPGYRAEQAKAVARIVNAAIDRSGVIRAEAAMEQAEARLAELTAYDARISALSGEWQGRRKQYADGFRRDLELKVQELDRRVALLQERTAIAEAASRRKGTLRLSGNASQADEDAAISSHRDLQATLADTVKELERTQHRRDLANRGIFLQEDGKEPEWSWRSIDEIRLEAAKAARSVGDAQQDLRTAKENLAKEQRNLAAASEASVTIPAGATVWSAAATAGAFAERGGRLFTWIDCAQLLVDVPVTETTAALVKEGSAARVTLEGELGPRDGIVVMSRASSSRLTKDELISVRGWRESAAQILVRLDDADRLEECPIGRRAFVRFPGLSVWQFLRAYLPAM